MKSLFPIPLLKGNHCKQFLFLTLLVVAIIFFHTLKSLVNDSSTLDDLFYSALEDEDF